MFIKEKKYQEIKILINNLSNYFEFLKWNISKDDNYKKFLKAELNLKELNYKIFNIKNKKVNNYNIDINNIKKLVNQLNLNTFTFKNLISKLKKINFTDYDKIWFSKLFEEIDDFLFKNKNITQNLNKKLKFSKKLETKNNYKISKIDINKIINLKDIKIKINKFYKKSVKNINEKFNQYENKIKIMKKKLLILSKVYKNNKKLFKIKINNIIDENNKLKIDLNFLENKLILINSKSRFKINNIDIFNNINNFTIKKKLNNKINLNIFEFNLFNIKTFKNQETFISQKLDNKYTQHNILKKLNNKYTQHNILQKLDNKYTQTTEITTKLLKKIDVNFENKSIQKDFDNNFINSNKLNCKSESFYIYEMNKLKSIIGYLYAQINNTKSKLYDIKEMKNTLKEKLDFEKEIKENLIFKYSNEIQNNNNETKSQKNLELLNDQNVTQKLKINHLNEINKNWSNDLKLVKNKFKITFDLLYTIVNGFFPKIKFNIKDIENNNKKDYEKKINSINNEMENYFISIRSNNNLLEKKDYINYFLYKNIKEIDTLKFKLEEKIDIINDLKLKNNILKNYYIKIDKIKKEFKSLWEYSVNLYLKENYLNFEYCLKNFLNLLNFNDSEIINIFNLINDEEE